MGVSFLEDTSFSGWLQGKPKRTTQIHGNPILTGRAAQNGEFWSGEKPPLSVGARTSEDIFLRPWGRGLASLDL